MSDEDKQKCRYDAKDWMSRGFGLLVIIAMLPIALTGDVNTRILIAGLVVIVFLLAEKRIDSPNIIPMAALVLVVAALTALLLVISEKDDIKHCELIVGVLATLAGVVGGKITTGKSRAKDADKKQSVVATP